VNHARFPKDDHLPYRARRDNKITKGDRADPFTFAKYFNKDEGHTLRTVGMWLAIPEYSILITCLTKLTSLGDLKTQVLRIENIGVL